MGDAFPTPNQRIAIGIHDCGEIGLSYWMIVFSVFSPLRHMAWLCQVGLPWLSSQLYPHV
jgi:hypothetical protein